LETELLTLRFFGQYLFKARLTKNLYIKKRKKEEAKLAIFQGISIIFLFYKSSAT